MWGTGRAGQRSKTPRRGEPWFVAVGTAAAGENAIGRILGSVRTARFTGRVLSDAGCIVDGSSGAGLGCS